MRAGSTERTETICTEFRRALAVGESQAEVVRYLAEAHDVQRPAVWKALRRGGVIPPYAPRQANGKGRPIGGGVPGYTRAREARAARRGQERRAEADALPRVNRDPCPRCGVRRDIGCEHSTIALGTIF